MPDGSPGAPDGAAALSPPAPVATTVPLLAYAATPVAPSSATAARAPSPSDPRAERENKEIKGVLVLVILASFFTTFAVALPWYAPLSEFGELSESLAEALFEEWVVPFEVLSVTLLAALMGALHMASRGGDAK